MNSSAWGTVWGKGTSPKAAALRMAQAAARCGATRERGAIFANCIGTLCDPVRKVRSLYNYIGSLEFPVGMYYCNLGRKSEQENAIVATQLPTRPLGAIRGQWPPSHASAWLKQQFSKMRNLPGMKIFKSQWIPEVKDSLGNGNSL